MKGKIIKTSIIGLVICAIFIFLQDVFAQETAKDVMKILCDSFFSVGVFMLCIGAISFCSQEGAYDIFGFSFSQAFSTFRKNISNRPYKTYAEYKQAKHPDSKITVSPCLFSGAFLTIVGLIFYFIYNQL